MPMFAASSPEPVTRRRAPSAVGVRPLPQPGQRLLSRFPRFVVIADTTALDPAAPPGNATSVIALV
jgi:hypothetical protein